MHTDATAAQWPWTGFSEAPEPFDEAVARTAGIDRFCSSSFWGIAALGAFSPENRPFVLQLPGGFAALAEGLTTEGERIWCPLESMWLLGTPIVGEPRATAAGFAAHALAHEDAWDAIWLSGMRRDTGVFGPLTKELRAKRLFIGPTAQRHEADLAEGFDAWFARRSAGFRKKSRQGLRRAYREGLTVEAFGPHNCHSYEAGRELFERVHAIETRSWKGLAGSGFATAGMKQFYTAMLPRLAAKGALRALVGRVNGQDACFLFGGVFAGTFRGLQMSFDDVHRELELGNAMQIIMLQSLAEEGVEIYDLGSDMPYKARWSDQISETFTLVVRR